MFPIVSHYFWLSFLYIVFPILSVVRCQIVMCFCLTFQHYSASIFLSSCFSLFLCAPFDLIWNVLISQFVWFWPAMFRLSLVFLLLVLDFDSVWLLYWTASLFSTFCLWPVLLFGLPVIGIPLESAGISTVSELCWDFNCFWTFGYAQDCLQCSDLLLIEVCLFELWYEQ